MIDLLAAAAVSGVPVTPIIHGDRVEVALWERVVRRASDVHLKLMRDQAILNANAVARLFRR